MADIRADSYSSEAEVTALTRHLLDGQSAFNSTTRPTETELVTFIDRASGVLNVAFRGAGFDPANITANSTAKLAADDWVTTYAAQFVELTQRGAGWGDERNSRLGQLSSMQKDAADYVAMLTPGLKEEGITTGKPSYQGLQFTAMDDYDQRSDPDSTSREQPMFRRRQFDNG